MKGRLSAVAPDLLASLDFLEVNLGISLGMASEMAKMEERQDMLSAEVLRFSKTIGENVFEDASSEASSSARSKIGRVKI